MAEVPHKEADVRIDLRARTGIESRFLDVPMPGGQTVRTHYRYSPGSGPAVVMLQGGILDSSTLTWRLTMEALPAHYRVFTPDLPGYGDSAKPLDAPYTTGYYVDFLKAFVDQLGLRELTLCGSSMSGAIVLGFATRHLDRLRAIVLSGAYGFQDRLPLHPLAYLAAQIPNLDVPLRALLRLHPNVVRAALPVSVYEWSHITDELVHDAYAGVNEERALMAFMRWLHSDVTPTRVRSNFTAALPRLDRPTLLLHGRHDWTMPLPYAERAHRLLPDARLHVFDDCGHLVPRERPDLVNPLVVDFLGRHA